jgi:hypothetical protein
MIRLKCFLLGVMMFTQFVCLWSLSSDWLRVARAGGTHGAYAHAIATDSLGNCYITGFFSGTVDFGSHQIVGTNTPTSGPSDDIFIAKLGYDGSWAWARAAGSSQNDMAYSIGLDSYGNCYVTGFFQGNAVFGGNVLSSSGSLDVFVCVLSSDGTWLWVTKAGGTDAEIGYGIDVDSGGNAYLTGCFRGTCHFGDDETLEATTTNVFIAKLTNLGVWAWTSQTTGTGNSGVSAYNEGHGIAIDSAGNSYITGFFGGTAYFGATSYPAGYTDVFVAKLDPDGEWLWAKEAGGSYMDCGYGIAVDADGSCYATGHCKNTYFGSTYISGSQNKVFITKLDTQGNWLWAKGCGGGSYVLDCGTAIEVDNSGNCLTTGYFYGNAYFGSTQLIGNGAEDRNIFVQKLDTQGNWMWAIKGGDAGFEQAFGIGLDDLGRSYVAGTFSPPSTFGTISLPQIGPINNTVFIGKVGIVPPLPPENVTISTSANDVILEWDEVTENYSGQTISVDYYKIFYRSTPDLDSPWTYLDQSTGTSFNHIGGAATDKRFYYIQAVQEE